MRILYLSLSYVPSRRASTVQVMRMCEAFSELGHEVTLLAKQGHEATADHLGAHAFYGVTESFEIERLRRPARRGGGLVYAASTAAAIARRRREIDLVYARDLVGGVIAAELGLPTAFEAHGIYELPLHRAMWRRMTGRPSFRGLVAISQAMVRELDATGLLPKRRPVLVAHSPATANPGASPRATVSARPRIGYVGNLYRGRGVELVVALAARMPHCDFELIGGSDADLAAWRAEGIGSNVMLRGFVAPARLAALYPELDVLLMPYPHAGIYGATQRIDTAGYCSPMKMFEYMASGVPIVASDLPVLQEILAHERNALIAPSGDLGAWQTAVQRLIEDRALRIALARRALVDVTTFTPRARAEKILGAIAAASGR
jgi:glycosyltransferase involved in cell wall biosynthesis